MRTIHTTRWFQQKIEDEKSIVSTGLVQSAHREIVDMQNTLKTFACLLLQYLEQAKCSESFIADSFLDYGNSDFNNFSFDNIFRLMDLLAKGAEIFENYLPLAATDPNTAMSGIGKDFQIATSSATEISVDVLKAQLDTEAESA